MANGWTSMMAVPPTGWGLEGPPLAHAVPRVADPEWLTDVEPEGLQIVVVVVGDDPGSCPPNV
jgi:hypothetical protein